MSADFDALVEKAARAIEGDVEYVVPKRDGSPLAVAHVHLTHDEALEVARAAISAAGLPALLERMEAAEAQRDVALGELAYRVEELGDARADRDALAAKVADAWDEGSNARGEALQKWYEPTSTELMYWPDVPNPYRAAPTEAER